MQRLERCSVYAKNLEHLYPAYVLHGLAAHCLQRLLVDFHKLLFPGHQDKEHATQHEQNQ